jgi:hypothetical protein
MADNTTHLINGYARPVGKTHYRAECGQLVDGSAHAREGKPTCPDCAAIQEDDEATAKALGVFQFPIGSAR